MLAAGEDGQWKEMLPPMGSGPDIPKLFKSASKARIPRPLDPLIEPCLQLSRMPCMPGVIHPEFQQRRATASSKLRGAQECLVTGRRCNRCETSS